MLAAQTPDAGWMGFTNATAVMASLIWIHSAASGQQPICSGTGASFVFFFFRPKAGFFRYEITAPKMASVHVKFAH